MTMSKESECEFKARYLQSELDDYRAADERRAEQEERARRERRREREEEFRAAARQADDWPEALRKGAALYRRKGASTEIGDDDAPFWENSARACERALEIWKAVERDGATEIADLEARILALRDVMRQETARRLRLAEPLIEEYAQTAHALLTLTPEGFLDW